MRPAVLFYTGGQDHLEKPAKEVLSGYEVFEQTPPDFEVARCVALITWPTRPTKQLFERLVGLKMVQTLSAGVDALDFRSLPPGVSVHSNAGAYTDSVAEHAWGLALGVAKGIHAGRKRLPPRHLRSKTLLVVGCGAIGSEVARLARSSLGMRVVGVSRSFKIPENFDQRLPMEGIGEAVGAADLIVNALPLTVSTRSLFDYGLLSKAKEAVVLVNIGRGETVEESSLKRWLEERPESRYATDVFWKRDGKEVFDTPLWDLPNFGGTIHTASAQDHDALIRAQVMAAENVRRFLETGTANNRISIHEYTG